MGAQRARDMLALKGKAAVHPKTNRHMSVSQLHRWKRKVRKENGRLPLKPQPVLPLDRESDSGYSSFMQFSVDSEGNPNSESDSHLSDRASNVNQRMFFHNDSTF